MPVSGLKPDLLARLAPVMVSEQVFRVAVSIARQGEVAIPTEEPRTDEMMSGFER